MDKGEPRLNWIESFLSFAHHRSFEAAAHELGLDIAVLVDHIAKIEGWLGFCLVSDKPNVDLTEDGAAFIDVALNIMNHFNYNRNLVDGERRKTYLYDEAKV